MVVPTEMPKGHVPCCFCGNPNPKKRVKINKKHCTNVDCVGEWRRRRLEAEELVLVFVHKQGLMWVKKSEVKKNDMRRQGGS